MTVFQQIESLPIAYFIVLMWVVCANVLAKLLGDRLIEATSGPLQQLLARKVNIAVTGDEFAFHLFERHLIANINTQLLFTLLADFVKWMLVGPLVPVPVEVLNFNKNMYPEKFWSGCPPNFA
jgi:hypothetical protein